MCIPCIDVADTFVPLHVCVQIVNECALFGELSRTSVIVSFSATKNVFKIYSLRLDLCRLNGFLSSTSDLCCVDYEMEMRKYNVASCFSANEARLCCGIVFILINKHT